MSKPKYTREDLTMAYDMVKSKVMTLNKAAKRFGIPRTTLGDKLRGKHPLDKAPKTVLGQDEEDKLVSWLRETTRRGSGRSKAQLLRTVQQILKAEGRPNPFTDDKPGDKWYNNFLKRHPDISRKKPQALGQQRAVITEAAIRGWFAEAEAALAADGIDIKSVSAERIFNCDETGFPVGQQVGSC